MKAVSLGKQKKKEPAVAYCERIGKYSASNYTGAVCLSVFGISNADEGPFYGTGSRRKKSAVTK